MNAPATGPALARPPIDLATVAPFALGVLEVQPARCRIRGPDVYEPLEPRVMQVLVVLATADGGVVSRAELIARCWAGRVVGDDAINRVVSRIRALGAGPGRDSFVVETINKVGYRLVVEAAPVVPAPTTAGAAPTPAVAVPTPAMAAPNPGSEAVAGVDTVGPTGADPGDRMESRPRRRLIGGTIAAVLVGAGATLAWRRGERRPSAEAAALYRKGVEAQRQGLAEQNVQAAAFFRQAVAVDGRYAAAWGALALAYRHLLETGRPEDDPATTAAWVRSAAARAFELDPHNADARVALILVKPYFRNLIPLEAEIRDALREHSDHWLLWGNLGRVLGEAGRWRDAIAPLRRAIEIDPFLPLSRARLATTLWANGDLQDAEATFDEAAARWPAHPSIWFPRFHFLAFSGQVAAALAMAQRTDTRPIGVADDAFGTLVALARAVDGAGPTRGIDVERATAALGTGAAVQYLARLGRVDAAFARLDAYFGDDAGASTKAAGGSLVRRYTDFLFLPPTVALHDDRRFPALTAAVGLDDYWRVAGADPDYRRGRSDGIG